MTAKNHQKHYKQNQKSFITSMFTHKEFVLMTGASSGEESTDIEQTCMIVQTYSGAKKYLVSHQLCKFSHLKRLERPVIFIIGIPQL